MTACVFSVHPRPLLCPARIQHITGPFSAASDTPWRPTGAPVCAHLGLLPWSSRRSRRRETQIAHGSGSAQERSRVLVKSRGWIKRAAVWGQVQWFRSCLLCVVSRDWWWIGNGGVCARVENFEVESRVGLPPSVIIGIWSHLVVGLCHPRVRRRAHAHRPRLRDAFGRPPFPC